MFSSIDPLPALALTPLFRFKLPPAPLPLAPAFTAKLPALLALERPVSVTACPVILALPLAPLLTPACSSTSPLVLESADPVEMDTRPEEPLGEEPEIAEMSPLVLELSADVTLTLPLPVLWAAPLVIDTDPPALSDDKPPWMATVPPCAAESPADIRTLPPPPLPREMPLIALRRPVAPNARSPPREPAAAASETAPAKPEA